VKQPEFHPSFDDCEGEESRVGVDIVVNEEQQSSEWVRPELEVHIKLCPCRRRPHERYEPGRRKLGIFYHDVCSL